MPVQNPQRQSKLGVHLPASQLTDNPFLWVNLLLVGAGRGQCVSVDLGVREVAGN